MDAEEQINSLKEALKQSAEDAQQLIRSLKLSLHLRIKLFCLACMRDDKKIAEIIINDGFGQSTPSGERSREELIQYLQRPDDPEGHLNGYIISTAIKDDMPVMGRVGKVYVYNILPRLKKVTLLTEDFRNIEMYLLDRSFLLERGVDVNKRVNGGYPLLHIALEMGDPAVVELFLSWGADPDMKDVHGSNALHAAAKSKAEGVVKWLLRYGADIHCVNRFGRTPLYGLANAGLKTEVELLLARGAKVDLADKNGDTPLHEASKGQPEIVELLLPYGARVNALNERGQTPLLCAAAFSNPEDFTPETRERVENVIEILVKNGADVNRADLEGGTALHFLAASGCERGVKLLLENGATANSVNSKGRTPLHEAAGSWTPSGRPAVVELLLRHGAEVDARDRDGQTPLVRAASCRDYFSLGNYELPQKDVVERLLNGGADPEASELSPLFRAILSNESTNRSNYEQPDVVRALLDHGAETDTLFANVPSDTRYISRALKTALEYGLVRDVSRLISLLDYQPQTVRRERIQVEEGLNLALPEDFENELYLIEGDEENREAVRNVVLMHILKLHAAGLVTSISPNDSAMLKSLFEDRPSDLLSVEVERMAERIPGGDLTVHDVLFMSVDRLARLACNDGVVEAFSSVERKFPVYGTMLKGRMRRGQERRRWSEAACRVCQWLFDQQLRHLTPRVQVPPEITERVVATFRDVEMKRLVIGFGQEPDGLDSWVNEEVEPGGWIYLTLFDPAATRISDPSSSNHDT
nr:PREDICTED: ankyrin-3-like isoform X1 [Bemisia tabaci]XP_018904144.1 PREDICTED: ankyrin-3-like isoform X1 [Bemisia tabaci]